MGEGYHLILQKLPKKKRMNSKKIFFLNPPLKCPYCTNYISTLHRNRTGTGTSTKWKKVQYCVEMFTSVQDPIFPIVPVPFPASYSGGPRISRRRGTPTRLNGGGRPVTLIFRKASREWKYSQIQQLPSTFYPRRVGIQDSVVKPGNKNTEAVESEFKYFCNGCSS